MSQEIVTYWLASDLYENHLIELRDHLKVRAKFVENILTEQFSSIATWESPQGGFYIWLRFNESIVTKDFFLKLLKRNVLINPGFIYDAEDTNHIRMSYSYASLDNLKVGLDILYEESLSMIKNSCTP
ncbi:hypothetical protein ACIQ4I_05410 [Rummeliibacillus sp. NPDC094406]|uniref:hypothetical protein n=1 Tax=Rummeliibacillus sp. NPDC094406 TaxID=3364511 RepID=UPI00380FF928